jgi:hypothetical protein
VVITSIHGMLRQFLQHHISPNKYIISDIPLFSCTACVPFQIPKIYRIHKRPKQWWKKTHLVKCRYNGCILAQERCNTRCAREQVKPSTHIGRVNSQAASFSKDLNLLPLLLINMSLLKQKPRLMHCHLNCEYQGHHDRN